MRLEYQALYGPSWEEKFHRAADTPSDKARAEYAAWAAKVKGRIAALRNGKGGKGVDLTQRQADALAGDWYRWFTSQHLDNPGGPKGWSGLRKELWDMAYRIAGDIVDDVEETPLYAVDFGHPEVLRIFDTETRASQFLTDRGVVLRLRGPASCSRWQESSWRRQRHWSAAQAGIGGQTSTLISSPRHQSCPRHHHRPMVSAAKR